MRTTQHEAAGRAAPGHDVVLGCLGFSAGFIDASCFLALYGVFTAHVTGNIATLASALVRPSEHWPLRLEVIGSFAVGAAASNLICARPGKGERRVLVHGLTVEALILLSLLAAGLWFGLPTQVSRTGAWLQVGLAGAAMGCQNALGKMPTGLALPTTVMTSNLAQWCVLASDWLRHRLPSNDAPRRTRGDGDGAGRGSDRPSPPQRPALLLSATVVLAAFVVGAVSGATAWEALHFACIAIPLAVVSALAFVLGRGL